MRRPSLTLAIVVAVFALVAVSCSDDDTATDPAPGDDTATSTTATTTTATPTTAEASTTTSDPGPAGFGDPLPTPVPAVELPPDAGSIFAQGTGFDLSLVGYEQSEYFISGTARSFAPVEGTELTEDGAWTVEVADEADYKTRMTVIRPSDPADFNGTVVMEWFNVTAGLDAAPHWTMSHVEQIREGYAWVGVSAQARGIEGGESSLENVPLVLHLKGLDPDRYGTLDHPGDSFSYDIYSQAAQVLLSPGDIDVLGGLEIEQLLSVGQSQSAFHLTTYVNALDPLAQLFDGYLVHSRGGGSVGLSQAPQAEFPAPGRVLIREDVRVPVLTFETETDVVLLGFGSDRQPDTDRIRTWEVAGTAHSDLYSISLELGPQDLGDDPSVAEVVEVESPIPGIIECASPINNGPQHWVMNAALHALAEWAGGGAPPTSAPPLEATDSGELVVDENGNALGGVRTAWVDVPVATLTGNPLEGGNYCVLFGTTTLFDDERLAELYPDKTTYLDAMTASVEASVRNGFIRPADAELILANAAQNRIGR